MKKTRTKKILTIILLVVLLVCFFSDIPQSLINMLSYRAEAETDTDGISVIIRADYSSASEIVLTAIFKNEKNETVDAEDVSDDITYTWYKSTASYTSTPFDANHKTTESITYEVVTASTSSSDNDSETATTSDNDADETEESTETETETESEEEASAEETEAQAKAVDNNAYSLFSWLGVLEAEAADEGSNSITVEKGYVYYVSVTVGGTGVTPLTAEPKYVSTDIAGVKIQNDIYRDSVLTALLVNSEGDTLYFSDGSDMTTYNGSASYTWYHYYYASNNTYIYSEETYTYNNAPAPGNTGNYTEVGQDGYNQTGENTYNTESTDKNTLTPLFTYSTYDSTSQKTTTTPGISYYYYVSVTIDGETYTSDWRIGTVYAGITVEIEQVKADDSNDITLNMVVYDDNGDVMYEDGSTKYYYNPNYTTTWYKSKEYFASTGDGTTADDNSEVATTATAPLGYAPQDYYGESNYMRVSNAVYNASTNTYGYTNSITVSDDDGGEVGRYYYVDINKNKTNGSAEAGADPVFVRNCTSTVVIEDDIATDGTFKAVVYNANGGQVDSTTADGYTYTWYKTVSGTSTYTNDKDVVKTSDAGRFISSFDTKTGSLNGAYYFDSGRFSRNTNATTKTSEYGGISMDKDTQSGYYEEVRDNLSKEIMVVSEVFANANYSFGTSGSGDKFALNDGVTAGTSLNDGSSCNVATDEGQLRYYYVEVVIDANTTYTSVVKYVKYSNQIENGGFQDSGNSTTYDSSLTTYWQTTNMGYADNALDIGYPETYYRLRPLLELATYTSSNAYGTYGNYYSFPGLSYDKENIETRETTDYINGTTVTTSYLRLNYDDDSTTDYLFPDNQFCEINSTDTNTLYQTVMTVPKMPLYWSLTHHARTSTATKANGGLTTLSTSETLYQDDTGSDVTLSGLGVTSASAYVAVDIMYVVIMNETDAESLLANGKDLDAQQVILDNMIDSITQSAKVNVIQSSEDGISYLARYDGSYTYPENGGTTYENISVWRVQTGSTKVQLTFSLSDATKAAAAANNADLLEYYADAYGTVKSYSYTSGSYSYATFYTESQTYADEYTIPDGQYVSRYFFVAGNSTNTPDGYNNNASLSFGSSATNYNGLSRATNTGSAGNFIDNVRFMQKLEVEVNYWLYDAAEGEYVLKKDDTEESSTYQDRWVTADADTVADYYSKYKFVGSYVSADGGDEDTPNEEELGRVTTFKADAESQLVLDLYYTPYDLEFEKKIKGLPTTMSYADFENALTITIYELTYDETAGTYTKSNKTSIDTKLEYDDTDKTLTLSTDYIFEKGYYLIEETTEILITDEFDGWFSVDMSVEIGGLEYDENLGGFILHVDEDEDGIDLDSYTSSDGKMEITVVNTYKPVAVECVKSVIFGSTDLTEINIGLTGTADYTGITSLKYESLTEYDEENSVDDTNITSDDKRRAVLSDDTLTYRMELTSTKKSTNVTVTDTVPDGCTLVEESIKILYQEREKTSGSHYGIVSAMLLTSDASVSKTVNGDTTTWTVYDASDPPTKLYEITYDSNNREITWWISEIGFYEQYYVEYEVKVDQIKASEEKDILENTAEYEYLSKYVSSDSLTSVEANMTASEDNGKVTYTVTFDGLSDYNVTWLKNTLPEGFILDTTTAIKINDTEVSAPNYTIKYYDSSGEELQGTFVASAISYFIIEPNGASATYIGTSSGTLTLTFTGTQDSTAAGTAGSNYRNATGIEFTDASSNEYCAVVSYGEGVTNQVETDVTHLYFEIEKTIYENDPAQTFLFEVAYTPEGGTEPTKYSYVTINCTNEVVEGDVTYYTGSTIVQSDERGTYTITEVTDWSYTDYEEIAASYINLTEIADTTLNTIMVEKSTEGITSVTLTLPGLYFTSNESTFPTALGTLETGTYATASFTDTASLYAYLSDQAYSYNVMQESQ